MYINKKGRATWSFLFVNTLGIIALWQWCHYISLSSSVSLLGCGRVDFKIDFACAFGKYSLSAM